MSEGNELYLEKTVEKYPGIPQKLPGKKNQVH
jgi:hypothetical protein